MKQRTTIYVDGFNLYYGCLRKTSYKWLDLRALSYKLLNDSDLAEPLRLIKTQRNKKIGLFFPNTTKNRYPSKQLAQHADFIKHIRQHVLANSQLPYQIPNTDIVKPPEW